MEKMSVYCGYVYLADKSNLRCLSLTTKAEMRAGVNKLIRLPGQLFPSLSVDSPLNPSETLAII